MSTVENRVTRSFRFFKEKLETQSSFELEELIGATGWSAATVDTYRNKKWEDLLERHGDAFFVRNLPDSLEEYHRMMSQKHSVSTEYQKPVLSPPIESLVTKAQQSAILALDVYNRPATIFRTEAFIVLMVIAWTALFHAIFQKQGIAYFYLNETGEPKMINGDKKAWELTSCMKEFYGSSNPPARQNLQFMIELRNKIEHRFSPEIDLYVAGECQAMLLNFDELMVEEFGEYFAIQEYLCVPLYTSSRRPKYQAEALKKFQAAQYDVLKRYIDQYRDNLDSAVYEDSKYSFKVFLTLKIGNRASSSDLALEFVNADSLEIGEQRVVAYKEKRVPVANQGKLKPTAVAKKVEEKLGRKFSIYNHTQAWRYYGVRGSELSPESCKPEYCQYDEAHKSFVYTPKWVDFLVLKLSDQVEYEKVTSSFAEPLAK